MSAPICKARSMPPPPGANSPNVLPRPLRPGSATRARRVRFRNGAPPLPRSRRKSPARIRRSAMPNASSASSIAKSRGWTGPGAETAEQARGPDRTCRCRRDQATLRVTYAVRNARWTPLYDARLDTGTRDRKPALELVRRAEITQNTGEDWSECRAQRFDRAHRARRQRAGSEFADRAISDRRCGGCRAREALQWTARDRRSGGVMAKVAEPMRRDAPTNSRPRPKSAASR